MVPMPPRTLDIVASPGDARAKARQRALPGEYGPRYVELTARKASMLRTWACLSRSGRKLSTTSITLPNMAVRMAWRSFSLEAHAHISSSDFGGFRTSNLPMARAGASAHAATSAMPSTASRPERIAEMVEQPVGIAVQQDRRSTGRADAGRLHLGLVDGARGEAQIVEDLGRDRELDRSGQLEAVAAGQLGGRGHPADEVVLLQAEDPHPPPGHDRGCGETVVAGPDDDGVVVRHRGHGSDVSRVLSNLRGAGAHRHPGPDRPGEPRTGTFAGQAARNRSRAQST